MRRKIEAKKQSVNASVNTHNFSDYSFCLILLQNYIEERGRKRWKLLSLSVIPQAVSVMLVSCVNVLGNTPNLPSPSVPNAPLG